MEELLDFQNYNPSKEEENTNWLLLQYKEAIWNYDKDKIDKLRKELNGKIYEI